MQTANYGAVCPAPNSVGPKSLRAKAWNMPLILDHVDLRVRDRIAAATFYDSFLTLLGAVKREGEGFTTWRIPPAGAALDDAPGNFGIVEDCLHVPGAVRIAFKAPSRDTVDTIAQDPHLAGSKQYQDGRRNLWRQLLRRLLRRPRRKPAGGLRQQLSSSRWQRCICGQTPEDSQQRANIPKQTGNHRRPAALTLGPNKNPLCNTRVTRGRWPLPYPPTYRSHWQPSRWKPQGRLRRAWHRIRAGS